MGIFYCKCKKCNHTGKVNLPSEKHTGSFKCSKCGSKDVTSVYRDTSNSTYRYIARNHNRTPINDYNELYYDELYEEKIFKEERLLDAWMLAPTGWEDDKEIQNYVGIYNKDINDNDIFLNENDVEFLEGKHALGRYAVNASQFNPILIDEDVEKMVQNI